MTTQTFTIGGNHAVVNRNKMLAGYHGPIENVLLAADCDNGYVCNLGGLATGYQEVYNAIQPATGTLATAKVLLIDAPEVNYFDGQNLKDFYNPNGSVTRAFGLHAGDVFTVSNSAIDGGVAVAAGSYVYAQNASNRLIANTVAPTDANYSFYGEIVAATTLGAYRDPAVKIKVLKA
jgi:hypothetical protein